MKKSENVAAKIYSINLDLIFEDNKDDSKSKVEIDEEYKNELLNFKLENFLENIDDSNIVTTSFIPYKSDSYLIASSIFNKFDYEKFDAINHKYDSKHINFIFRVPSKPLLLSQNKFNVFFRILDPENQYSNNILIKLISKDFSFSESMIKLDKEEETILFTKIQGSNSYIIKIKVYLNNILTKTFLIDLWERN